MESEMNFEIKELTSEIRDLVTQIKKSWGCCCNQNVNEKLVNQQIEIERLRWANVQYLRRECLEVVGIPTSIANDLLEANVSNVFW